MNTPRPSAWRRPVSWLPPPLLEARAPLRAILIGWLTAFLPSLVLGGAVSLLLPRMGQPEMAISSARMVALFVLFAPVIETLIMAGVLSLLLRFLPATVAVLVSAAGWGIAHSLAAPAWGLVVWWPFLIFSVLYVTWRKQSMLAALAIPAATHGLQNLVPTLLIFAGTVARTG